MDDLPNSQVAGLTFAPSSFLTTNFLPIDRYLRDLDKSIDVDFTSHFPASSQMLVVCQAQKTYYSEENTPQVLYSPSEGSPAAVSVANFKPRLFQLSVRAALRLAPLNHLISLLARFFNLALIQEISLSLSDLLENIDFEKFVQAILAHCLKQSTMNDIADILKVLSADNRATSKIIIDELLRVIFPTVVNTQTRLSSELAIAILMEVLNTNDSFQSIRLAYTFQNEQFCGAISRIQHPEAINLNSIGLSMLCALCSMALNFPTFKDYLVANSNICSFLREVIHDALEWLEYNQHLDAKAYRDTLNVAFDTLAISDDVEEPIHTVEMEVGTTKYEMTDCSQGIEEMKSTSNIGKGQSSGEFPK